jgi:hypothetical protein
MSSRRPLLSISRPRRFTRNILVPLHLAGRPLLAKYTRNPAEARAEVSGHRALSPHYRIPALHARLRVPGGYLLLYERLPGGPDSGLFLDLLNATHPTPELTGYLDDLTTRYRRTILATARRTSPNHLVRKLYWDRAAPGGRLDHYYAAGDLTLTDGTTTIPATDLAHYTLTVNGHRRHLDWTATLTHLRTHFSASTPVWAAITQGDPTDVNLAHPLAWLDFDTGGPNSIAGEFANFLWYTTVLGGWLVPTYNPAAFTDHPAIFTHLPVNTPTLHHAHFDTGTQTIRLAYKLLLSPPRRLAAATYWHQLVLPVAARLWPGQNLAGVLRPYLAMRILAVYNLANLAPPHRLLLLARLVEVLSEDFDPAAFFLITEAPCPAR